MNYNKNKVDDTTLALMYLVTWRQKKDFPMSAWKSFDWETMDRLFDKGFISDPKSKAKSVRMSDEGFQRAKQFFEQMFGEKE